MAELDQQIQVAYQEAFGRDATKQELDYYNKNGYQKLVDNLKADPNAGGNFKTSTVTTPGEPGATVEEDPLAGMLGYDEWLKSAAGSSYANAFSEESINAQFDPYYNKQLGGEDYQKGLAGEQLERNLFNTQKYKGESAADAGLFGSGVYQQELGKSLGDLNRGYQQEYGSGEYTPYSLRKEGILQEQQIAKTDAGINREIQAGGAFDRYRQQILDNQ